MNYLLIIGLTALTGLNAMASPTHTLQGSDADKLYTSLKATGTAVTQRVETAQVTITNLVCNAGYQPPVGSFATCDFMSSETKAAHSTGEFAISIFNLISKSGVKWIPETETASIKVSSVSCSIGGIPKSSTCTIVE